VYSKRPGYMRHVRQQINVQIGGIPEQKAIMGAGKAARRDTSRDKFSRATKH